MSRRGLTGTHLAVLHIDLCTKCNFICMGGERGAEFRPGDSRPLLPSGYATGGGTRVGTESDIGLHTAKTPVLN